MAFTVQRNWSSQNWTAPPSLAAPTNIGVWPGETQASLYWRDASGGDATGFKVYRSTTQGFTPGAGNLIHTTGTDTNTVYDARAGYVDEGLTNDTTYYYRVKATDGSNDSSATSEVSVTPKAGGTPDTAIGAGANEPAGFTRFLEWDQGHAFPPFDSAQVTGCDTVEGVDGSAVGTSGDDLWDEHVLVHEPSAPVGGPMCHEIRYSAHRTGESSSASLYAWETPTDDPCDIINDSMHEYQEVYVREHRIIWTDRDDGKVEQFGTGADFKFGHLRGHLPADPEKGFNLTLGVAIDTGLTHQAAFPVKFRAAWDDVNGDRKSKSFGQNLEAADTVIVGQWFEIEWYFKTNTIAGDGTANADGIGRCWVDGVLVLEHTNVKMRSSADATNEEHIQSYDHVTTWSGSPSSVHEHNKGFLISHMYLSGAGKQ